MITVLQCCLSNCNFFLWNRMFIKRTLELALCRAKQASASYIICHRMVKVECVFRVSERMTISPTLHLYNLQNMLAPDYTPYLGGDRPRAGYRSMFLQLYRRSLPNVQTFPLLSCSRQPPTTGAQRTIFNIFMLAIPYLFVFVSSLDSYAIISFFITTIKIVTLHSFIAHIHVMSIKMEKLGSTVFCRFSQSSHCKTTTGMGHRFSSWMCSG